MTRDRIGVPATCAFLLALSMMSVPSVRAVSDGDTASGARSSAASTPDTTELEILALVNGTRAAASLPALQPDAWLAPFARTHTRQMMDRGGLFHSAREARATAAPAGWRRIGENVGVGHTPGTLHEAFMASPGHRDNILGDYDGVAIGADRGDDGRLFVTVVFVKRGIAGPEQVATNLHASR